MVYLCVEFGYSVYDVHMQKIETFSYNQVVDKFAKYIQVLPGLVLDFFF